MPWCQNVNRVVLNELFAFPDPVPRESTMDSNHSIYFLSMLSGKIFITIVTIVTLAWAPVHMFQAN